MTVLEDLDYADNIGLLSSKHQAERLSKTVSTIGLKVNTKKTQVLRKNTRVNDPVMIDWEHPEDIEEFTKVTTTRNCDQEINTRISSQPIFRHADASIENQIKIFRSIVLSILYGAECWKTTVTIQQN